jgi:hypothetical protein
MELVVLPRYVTTNSFEDPRSPLYPINCINFVSFLVISAPEKNNQNDDPGTDGQVKVTQLFNLRRLFYSDSCLLIQISILDLRFMFSFKIFQKKCINFSAIF